MSNEEKTQILKTVKNFRINPLKKLGAILTSMVLISSTSGIVHAKDHDDCNLLIQLNHSKKIEELRKTKNYDENLMKIYSSYNFEIQGRLIDISRIYIAYGYNINNVLIKYIVVPSMGNYNIINGEKNDLHDTSLVQLRNTTVFTELLENGLIKIDIKNKKLKFDENEELINNIVKNWDGSLHNLVPETDAMEIVNVLKR